MSHLETSFHPLEIYLSSRITAIYSIVFPLAIRVAKALILVYYASHRRAWLRSWTWEGARHQLIHYEFNHRISCAFRICLDNLLLCWWILSYRIGAFDDRSVTFRVMISYDYIITWPYGVFSTFRRGFLRIIIEQSNTSF